MGVTTVSASNVSWVGGQRVVHAAAFSTTASTGYVAHQGRRNDHRNTTNQIVSSTGYHCRARQREPLLDLVVPGQAVAVDCEGQELPDEKGLHYGRGIFVNGIGRVSVVREDGKLIYDTFVHYPDGVRTKRSPRWLKLGVRDADIEIENGAQPLKKVLNDLKAIFDKSGIVVGHAMHNEVVYTRGLDELTLEEPIAGIDWSSYSLRDTQLFSQYDNLARSGKIGLDKLHIMFYSQSIQQNGHNSILDARATMKLYMRRKAEIDAEQSNLIIDPLGTRSISYVEDVYFTVVDELAISEESQAETPDTSNPASVPERDTSPRSSLSVVDSAIRLKKLSMLAPGRLVAIPDLPSLRNGRKFDYKTSTYF